MAPTYEPKAKRRKLEGTEAEAEFTIKSAADLHDLLRFKQSSSHDVKQGIQKFKDFLDDIGKAEKEFDRINKLQILKEYCDDQSSGDKGTICFLDLISTWSFAAQSNNDNVLSAVPAVLALFLKTISTRIQFREFGLSLCRTLLEKDQLRLFDRGLTSAKSKEFLISPCLRLLTEIVSFDGGALANSLYLRRDTVFKRLDVLLDHRTTTVDESEEQRRRPTVRRNAQRYVLANLKFQSSSVKGDLIAEGKILRRTLQGIARDGSDIIVDILQSVRKYILEDTALSRKSKTRFLNAANLASLASLYRVQDQIEASAMDGVREDATARALSNETFEDRKDVRTQVHNLLLAVCTHQEDGVLLPESGWYPLGNDPEEFISLGEIDLGLDSPLHFDNYERRVPVKNGTLSTFIEGLVPATDTLQANLMLNIFEVAPELVADYFSKKGKFTSEPKAEPGWLGEAAFLFSVIKLPIPAYCGRGATLPPTPPPVSIVIESIVPRPLDRPTLNRCFNLNDEVIALFASRVVSMALKKLQKVLALFRTAAHEPDLWQQAADRLKKAFIQRCPQFRAVVQAIQRTSKDDLQLRGALVELLATYFRVLPSVGMREKFDVSAVLAEVISRLNVEATGESEKSELLEQMSNLVFVAEKSPSTNWWNKSGSDHSLFCRLLAIVAAASASPEIQTVKFVLRTVLVENGVLSNQPRAFDALLASLHKSKKWSPSLATYAFIDNCIGRVVRQPVHYLDLLTLAIGENAAIGSRGTLVASIAEQWPFVAKNDDVDAQKNVAEWIARFFSVSGSDEEDASHLKIGSIFDNMITAVQGTAGSILESAFKKQSKHPIKLEPLESSDEPRTNSDLAKQEGMEHQEVKERPSEIVLEDLFGTPGRSPNSLQSLDRWENADLESAVSSGRLGRLLQCVASEEEEIRRQAFLILRQLMSIVKNSSYAEKGPMYLLLGEVCETAQEGGLETRTPSAIAEVASQIAAILADPSHKMYGKVNKFLNRAPSWSAQKAILYWIDRVLLKEPEDDGGHDLEVDWLLQLLVNSLRTSEDMELYRKSNVFERILSLYCSPQLSTKTRHKILQVAYRAVQVGGSMTLITRAGILGWIDIQVAVASGQDPGVLKALKSAIENSTNQEEVEAWKTRSNKQ